MPDPKRTAEDGYDFTARWLDHPQTAEELAALMVDVHVDYFGGWYDGRPVWGRDVGGPNGARPALDRERARLRREGLHYVPPVRSGCHRRALGLVGAAVALAALIIRRKR